MSWVRGEEIEGLIESCSERLINKAKQSEQRTRSNLQGHSLQIWIALLNNDNLANKPFFALLLCHTLIWELDRGLESRLGLVLVRLI